MCLLHSRSDTFRGCVPSLAQRLFDPAPEVRMATAEATGKLMTEWTYRCVKKAIL